MHTSQFFPIKLLSYIASMYIANDYQNSNTESNIIHSYILIEIMWYIEAMCIIKNVVNDIKLCELCNYPLGIQSA